MLLEELGMTTKIKGLLIGDGRELFSIEQVKALSLQFDFDDIKVTYKGLNKLYSLYAMYSRSDPGLPKKDVKSAYRAISRHAEKLANTLNLPIYDSAKLHSELGTSRHDVLSLLAQISFSAEALADEIKADSPGRRKSTESGFILGLIDLYQEGTGRTFDDIVFNPTQDEDLQYQGKSLLFLRTCIAQAGVRKTDSALVQLIKRNKKHK